MFYAYAKTWWRDYTQISESHEKRIVKVFAQTEYGMDLPMCSFVRPMRAGRLLDSPRHAARFVSLLALERDSLGSFSSGR
jgi:centrosomal protein CEP76